MKKQKQSFKITAVNVLLLANTNGLLFYILVITKAPRKSIISVYTKTQGFHIKMLIRNPSAEFYFWLSYDKLSSTVSKTLLSHLEQVPGKRMSEEMKYIICIFNSMSN